MATPRESGFSQSERTLGLSQSEQTLVAEDSPAREPPGGEAGAPDAAREGAEARKGGDGIGGDADAGEFGGDAPATKRRRLSGGAATGGDQALVTPLPNGCVGGTAARPAFTSAGRLRGLLGAVRERDAGRGSGEGGLW